MISDKMIALTVSIDKVIKRLAVSDSCLQPYLLYDEAISKLKFSLMFSRDCLRLLNVENAYTNSYVGTPESESASTFYNGEVTGFSDPNLPDFVFKYLGEVRTNINDILKEMISIRQLEENAIKNRSTIEVWEYNQYFNQMFISLKMANQTLGLLFGQLVDKKASEEFSAKVDEERGLTPDKQEKKVKAPKNAKKEEPTKVDQPVIEEVKSVVIGEPVLGEVKAVLLDSEDKKENV